MRNWCKYIPGVYICIFSICRVYIYAVSIYSICRVYLLLYVQDIYAAYVGFIII